MPFRLHAKNVFLTYPQCNLSPETVGRHLSGLRPATFIQVSRERHQDGAYHLHCLLQWADKFNCRNNRLFDIEGFHPNIQSVRSVSDVYDYINKAIPDNPTAEDKWTTGTVSINPKTDKWLRVATAATEEECLEAALEASPRDFVLNHDKIVDYARKKQRQIEPYRHDETIRFALPPAIAGYIANEFCNPVGLCPWLQYENHIISVDTDHSIVLKRCCYAGQPERERQLGPDRWVSTFTGGACLTSRHSPPKHNTLSWTTYRLDSCRTKSSGGAHN